MPRLVWTSGLHQQGPESKIWPSCCSRRSTGSGRRWRPRKLLTHQEQVRNHVGRVFGDPRDPIALTCCVALNPRRWRTGASCPSATSPLGRKVALEMCFGLWGVASCFQVRFLLRSLRHKAAKSLAWRLPGGVPLSGRRQPRVRTAAADDPTRPSRCRSTPGSPSTPVLASAGGGGLGAFASDPPQTGCSPQIPPPPRRPYATRSCPNAWFSGRYPQWGS